MLDKVSAYCSILGLGISIVTLLCALFINKKLKNFEKGVLFNNRVPQLLNDLAKHHSALNISLRSQDERKIKEAINACKTVIESINPKLPNDLKKQGIQIERILKKQYKSFQIAKAGFNWKIWRTIYSLEDIDTSYIDLNSFMTKIDYLKQDKDTIR